MKRVLGLDLGTTSIGWALINEAEDNNEKSGIIKAGVRVNPLTVDEQQNFEKGKSITTNADRTLKRSMRRNLQRYKLRRTNLVEILKAHGILKNNSILSEQGNHSTFSTYKVRALAPSERIDLEDFARVLLMINKKRGYKSSRKVKSDEDGVAIDGMDVAKALYEANITPGQYTYQLLLANKRSFPDYYRSDLKNELLRIWEFQREFYPDELTPTHLEAILLKNKNDVRNYFSKEMGIESIELKGKQKEKRLQRFEIRNRAISDKISLAELVEVITEITGEISASSGYLGQISDRSKELIMSKQTVGQYLWEQISKNPHTRLKGQVFYRKDYLDEFEAIWSEQCKHYAVLTEELKAEIRDVTIFYQRKLKSQKGLIGFCEFERKEIEIVADGKKKVKTIGSRVIPRSSPLFQEFMIWSKINDLEVFPKSGRRLRKKKVLNQGQLELDNDFNSFELTEELKEELFNELNYCDKLTKTQLLKMLVKNPAEWDLNFESLAGNSTNAAIISALKKIAINHGYDESSFSGNSGIELKNNLKEILENLEIKSDILEFDSSLDSKQMQAQSSYQLWHLLYSYVEDDSATGVELLKKQLTRKFGFKSEDAKVLAGITFVDDYGSLSAKAIREILPHLKAGNRYSVACGFAGYNHSHSETKTQSIERIRKERLEILPKNSLRNPVVEKILNQMINTVNAICDEFGKPDEIRIELARELKKSAKEREKMTQAISKSTKEHETIRKKLKEDFGLPHISRNHIIRYKLYQELKDNNYHTFYSNTYIAPDQLFGKTFDIEHIIPQARLFDDSFSNKTLELRSENALKSDLTAYDFVATKGENALAEYEERIERLFKNGQIGFVKRKKLLMKGEDIPDGFIDRELRDTQYIAKKAKSLLEDVFKKVLSTTGSVTELLREDWQLVHVMRELNWPKYHAQGLTTEFTNSDGDRIQRIKDWTKRTDHRHHAMDAITVAFTRHSHIQWLNYLNARKDENHKKASAIHAIENKELYRDERNKLRFKPPIPLVEFRASVKEHLENILVSHKAKNKVVTRNKNTFKVKDAQREKVELTPRGSLHQETVYGSHIGYTSKMEKVSGKFDSDKIALVAKKKYREALLTRLSQFEDDPKAAFTGKNSFDKNPIFLNELQTERVPDAVKLLVPETIYTIRKAVAPDLNVDKVIDPSIKSILQERLREFNGNPKEAFVNLENNPIWLNQEKGIQIKRVAVSGIANATALRSKKDKDGNLILSRIGKSMPVDYVNTGNNHHVAIYIDNQDNLQEDVVSFYKTVERKNQNMPVIDKAYNQEFGWRFLFSMKQNECFVVPNTESGFDPNEIDLLDESNFAKISPNLFRVQKVSTKDYVFRHHLETTVEDRKELKGKTWIRVQSPKGLHGFIKVRLNHIGKIVTVGEE